MSVIWKYPIAITDHQTIEMPADARILSCQEQYGGLALWALVTNTDEVAQVRIVIIGTGNQNDWTFEAMRFIDTVQQFDGQLVWHVWEHL